MASAVTRKRGRSESETPNKVLTSGELALPDIWAKTAFQSARCAALPDTKDQEHSIAEAVTQEPKVDDDKNLITCQEVARSGVLKPAEQESSDNVIQSDVQDTVIDQNPHEKRDSHNKIVGPARDWPDRKQQNFDYFLVTDLEWTCTEKDPQPEPREIWEIATVLLNAQTLQIEDSFQTYCRPQLHPILTDFCKEKMNITQDKVDKEGVLLKDALDKHILWFYEKELLKKRCAVVTWSSWDCKIVGWECGHKKIRKPAYFNKWIDLRDQWSDMYPDVAWTLQGGLKGRVEYSGLEWEGQEHSAKDDAVNTARLAADMIKKGCLLEIGDMLDANGRHRKKRWYPEYF